MSEAIDETLDKDEAKEETEDLTNHVLDEIGVGVALKGKVISSFLVCRVSQKLNLVGSFICF